MVPLKKAAAITGVDKRILRGKLVAGVLQGERRVVGEKARWYISVDEFDGLMAQQPAERTSLDGLNEFFTETSEEDAVEASEPEEAAMEPAPVQIFSAPHAVAIEDVEVSVVDDDAYGRMPWEAELDRIVQSLTIEFACRLADERQAVLRLQQRLDEKEAQLLRIPDLENELRSRHLAADEKASETGELKKQIAALESTISELRKPWWKRLFGA